MPGLKLNHASKRGHWDQIGARLPATTMVVSMLSHEKYAANISDDRRYINYVRLLKFLLTDEWRDMN